jgi:hypothetical protein
MCVKKILGLFDIGNFNAGYKLDMLTFVTVRGIYRLFSYSLLNS